MVIDFTTPEPTIDPTFSGELGKLPSIDEALYAASYHCQEARTPEERTSCCDEYDVAAQELLMVYLAVMQHGQRMREALNPAHTGRVIPLRRRQPRDARGRFTRRID